MNDTTATTSSYDFSSWPGMSLVRLDRGCGRTFHIIAPLGNPTDNPAADSWGVYQVDALDVEPGGDCGRPITGDELHGLILDMAIELQLTTIETDNPDLVERSLRDVADKLVADDGNVLNINLLAPNKTVMIAQVRGGNALPGHPRINVMANSTTTDPVDHVDENTVASMVACAWIDMCANTDDKIEN